MRDRSNRGDDALSAHVVSLHVPLTASGSHPTVNLIGLEELTRMRDDAILINTARGGVVDESALRTLLTRRPRMAAVIDCWRHEPGIDVELLRRAAIGTPHIAGYSDDAKLRATEMLLSIGLRIFKRAYGVAATRRSRHTAYPVLG